MSLRLSRAEILRRTPLAITLIGSAFVLIWVLFLGNSTTFGPAIDDPGDFLKTVLDTVTIAGLYFIVASGFTLIFGLMRVVNMAHGAFFLLGGWFAVQFQREWVGGSFFGGAGGGLSSDQVSFANWILPLLAVAGIIGAFGLFTQQVFLRWNQGQELRQALITIAISIILADQMRAHFGGINKDIAWFGTIDQFVSIQVSFGWALLVWTVIVSAALLGGRAVLRHYQGIARLSRPSAASLQRLRSLTFCQALPLVAIVAASFVLVDVFLAYSKGFRNAIPAGTSIHSVAGVQYSGARLFMLGVAVLIGIGLWVWLMRTKTGMVIRAGVDDRAMVSALGINIQLVFAIAFFVGAALAGVGGVMGGTFAGVGPGVDGSWLLNSLVVVIIGGMGSLGGAAVGAILYGTVTSFSAVYLPSIGSNCCTQYSIILTFALLTAVLALRPLGLFGRPA